MKRTNLYLAIAAVSFLVGGCGGGASTQKKETKTAQDVKGAAPETEGALLGRSAPVRDVSGEAKEDFAKAAKYYEGEAKTGVTKSNCGSIAEKFGAVYKNHSKLPEAKFNEGVVWEVCGDSNKAEAAYQQVIADHPNYGPALNNLGELYASRGQMGQAETYFKRAADQKNSEGYANIALMQRNQALSGNPNLVSEAVENIHRALAVDSFNIEAYTTLATVLYDHAKSQTQLEMARLICVQATKVDDRYAPLYNTLGLILLAMDKVTPALAEFRKAVEIDPNFLEAHLNIGAVTLSFRDYDSAEKSFAKVLSLNPQKKHRIDATVGLGVAYRGQRKYAEAMKKYKEAYALDSSNVDIDYNIGILIQDYMFDAGNPSQGIAQLQQASSYLNRYVSSGRNKNKVNDAQKRIKNINELVPMLQEQQKMAAQAPAPEPPPAKAPEAAPAGDKPANAAGKAEKPAPGAAKDAKKK